MRQKIKVTVLVDENAVPPNDPNFESPSENLITEYHVVETLRTLGYEVSVLAVTENIAEVVNSLTEKGPDLVFNLTEHFAGDRRQDKNIAALLEMTSVPFTGTGPAGLMLCRDKGVCKQLLTLHRIRVPNFVTLPLWGTPHVPKSLRYPLVVKPALEDSSEGISNASLVADAEALRQRAAFVHEHWDQPAIAEEYIEGRELYVSVLGNKRLTILPPRECFFEANSDQGPLLLTYRVKWNKQYREKWKISFGFAELDAAVLKRIERTCKNTYRILHLRDFGRIDIRLTPDNKIFVLEANPNPDVAYGEEVAEAAEKAGLTYEKLIDRIVRLALRRYD